MGVCKAVETFRIHDLAGRYTTTAINVLRKPVRLPTLGISSSISSGDFVAIHQKAFGKPAYEGA